MKVFLKYEDNENPELHKTLKITLPKSWRQGPTSKLITQFVESYNASPLGERNQLDEADLHLAIRPSDSSDDITPLTSLASDAISIEVIPDRSNVYVMHGPSVTLAQMQEAAQQSKQQKDNLVSCTHFGCKKRFPRGGPYPPEGCCYHRLPPVFHETAKFWSCCPDKKAYDWNDFEAIPGCQTGVCTEIKEDGQKDFLGGTDLREEAGKAVELKSIDDFNKAQGAGGAAPLLERLKATMKDLGIEVELFDQVVEGMKQEVFHEEGATEAEVLEAVAQELGAKLKEAMKAIAADQLRLK